MTNPDRADSLLPLALSIGRYLAAQVLVALSTIMALWISSRWGSAAVEMIYLPAVLAAGVWWGFGPAVLAAVTSALTYNYYFTEPLYSFRIDSPVDIVDVTILFIVAVVTSHLAAAVRRQARIAEAHAHRNATIAGFARRLLSCPSESEIVETAAREIGALFSCNAVVVTGFPHPSVIGTTPSAIEMTPADIAAAAQALQTGEPTGRGIAVAAPTEWAFHPIKSKSAPIAALGLSRDDGLPPVRSEDLLLLESLIDQTALALVRARETQSNAAHALAFSDSSIRAEAIDRHEADQGPPGTG